MKTISISLGPSNTLLAIFPSHQVSIPLTADGLAILQRILAAHETQAAPALNTDALPTQWLIDQWLSTPSNGEKMLAGKVKRWKEAEVKTGVRTRALQFVEPFIDLSGIDLE